MATYSINNTSSSIVCSTATQSMWKRKGIVNASVIWSAATQGACEDKVIADNRHDQREVVSKNNSPSSRAFSRCNRCCRHADSVACPLNSLTATTCTKHTNLEGFVPTPEPQSQQQTYSSNMPVFAQTEQDVKLPWYLLGGSLHKQ